MIITATELKANLGHYLELVAKEDIVITPNGKRIDN
jgi:prevent-host-death family protein